MTIPLIIVSDAPNMQSGLARISRDLTNFLNINSDKLGIRVSQLGMNYDGSPWPWRVYDITDTKQWGAKDIENVLAWEAEGYPSAIVLTIWDPYRCYSISEAVRNAGADLWGYFPIDCENIHGKLSGVTLEAVKRYDRVLAYGMYGAGVLKSSLGRSIQYLPHGLNFNTSRKCPLRRELLQATVLPKQFLRHDVLIGCVATNQPRKDWALVFNAVDILRKRYRQKYNKTVGLWAHTDLLINHWSFAQLAEDFDMANDLAITQEGLTDNDLYTAYAICHATIHPGLGEGFGYPIVESLMVGTPPVHGSYAGGAELITDANLLVEPVTYRTEGLFTSQRPVFDPVKFADKLEYAVQWKLEDRELLYAYLKATVSNLNWNYLWPRWNSWFKQGIEAIKRREE